MQLSLYSTKDDENVINKDLILKNTINIMMKNTVEVVTPIIILKDTGTLNMMECNYCFIDELQRFYFIRDIELMGKNMYRLTLECDVLESFKDDILASECEYSKTISDGDYMAFNPSTDVRKVVSTYSNDFTLTKQKNIILSSIGGV